MQGPGRQQGVTIPASQLSAGTGEPRNVQFTAACTMQAIQYSDDNGQLHNEIVLVVGTVVYLLPGGEAWAANLRPAADWLTNKVLATIKSATAPLPKSDQVDILDLGPDYEHNQTAK